MIDALARRHAHAERDPSRDPVHDRPDAAEVLEVGAGQLGLDGLVAAPNVKSHAGRRDVPLVGNRSADRLAVARVVVGAQDAVLGVTGGHTSLELVEAALVDPAECLDVHQSYSFPSLCVCSGG